MIVQRYKQNASGKYSIYLDIRTKGEHGEQKRTYEFLRIYVSKDYSKTRRILKEDEQKMELARSICSKRELEINGNSRNVTQNGQRVNLSLLQYIQSEFDRTKRDGYIYLLQHVQKFSNKKDVIFSDVSTTFLNSFAEYLETKIARNTVVKYLRMLKQLISKAFSDEIISENPFARFEMLHKQEVVRGYLTLRELRLMNETETWFEDDIRQGFLFSCFTGLRHSDVKSLTYSQITAENNSENEYEQRYTMQLRPVKTANTKGTMLQVPLSQQAISIFLNMKKMNKTLQNDFVFSKLPNKDLCSYHVKQWALKAGIKKHVNFHLARHTFATLSLTSGIDIYTVGKLLGHSSIVNTQVYAKIIDEKKKEEVKKFPQFL